MKILFECETAWFRIRRLVIQHLILIKAFCSYAWRAKGLNMHITMHRIIPNIIYLHLYMLYLLQNCRCILSFCNRSHQFVYIGVHLFRGTFRKIMANNSCTAVVPSEIQKHKTYYMDFIKRNKENGLPGII